MEWRVKSNEPTDLADYLARFPELADEPRALSELIVAESSLRRRISSRVPDHDRCHAATDTILRIGRYELRETIGEGAFGVVYRAWDTTLNRAVALKRPRPGAIIGREAIERFVREARNAAALHHPRIVRVHDAGQVEDVAYLVSELVEGRNLADELKARRPGLRQAAEWVAVLAEALEHAHSLGVIHRDVKPSNILIDTQDRVFLTDFGLAKSDSGEATLTADGQLIGTPAYMAPEQARGEMAKLDELLTGTRPHPGNGPLLLTQIEHEEPRPPRRLDIAIPLDLETVCLKAMAKEPDRRYPTAAEFAADLRRYLQGEPVLARPEGRTRMMVRKCRRHPMLTGLAACLVLTVVSGLVGVTWQWRRAEANLVRVDEQRRKAIYALSAGNRVITRLAELANDQILGAADRDSGALSILLFQEYRELVGALHEDPAFLPALVDASTRIARVLDDCAPLDVWHAAWRETLVHAETLVQLNPNVVAYLMALGDCHYQFGSNLGHHGRVAEGDEHLRRSRQTWLEARQILRAELEVVPNDRSVKRQLCECELFLGQHGYQVDQSAEAIAGLREALQIASGLCQEKSDDPDLMRLFGEISSELALLLRRAGPDEALALARSAVTQFETILQAQPSSYERLFKLAKVVDRLAAQEDQLDQTDAALRDFRRAASLYERLLEDRPFNVERRAGLATVLHQIGRILVDAGHAAEAIEPYQRAIELREALLSRTPGNIHRRSNCAGTWQRLAEAREKLGRIKDAVEAYRNCLAHQRVVYSLESSDAGHRTYLDDRLRDTSWLLLVLGRSDEAAQLVRERKALRPNDLAVPLCAAIQQVGAILTRRINDKQLALIKSYSWVSSATRISTPPNRSMP
jgi:tetratricopeptide (TPR) repeat protein